MNKCFIVDIYSEEKNIRECVEKTQTQMLAFRKLQYAARFH